MSSEHSPSALCPANGEFCALRDFCIETTTMWEKNAAKALKQQQRQISILNSVWSVPLRLLNLAPESNMESHRREAEMKAQEYARMLNADCEVDVGGECAVAGFLEYKIMVNELTQ